MTSISTSGFGSLFTNSAAHAASAQTAWAVDPATGNDRNAGTPSEPLATMAELNGRLHTIRFTVAPTITLVGNVTDAPFMFNGVLAPGLGMTISASAVATEGTATLTTVTALGPSGTYPWQLTTTGRTWTSGDVGKRVSLASGHFSWVQEFIDANNIVTGVFINTGGSLVTPTAQAMTVDTLSQVLIPTFGGMANSLAQSIVFNNFDFLTTVSAILINQGTNLLLSGCRITKNSSSFIANGPITARGCGFPGNAGHTFRGSAITTLTATTWVSGNFIAAPTQMTLSSHSASGCPHTFNGQLFSQINLGRIRNTASPITVQNGGLLTNNNTLHGATGNTGVGITVKQGSQFQWVGAGAKPTLTGASDVQVGATGYTYAQLGTGVVDLTTASPPVITGTPAAMFQV